MSQDLTLQDFRDQFPRLREIAVMHATVPEGENPDAEFRKVQGMIDSMTKDERRNPDLIDQSRRRRIASGAGVEPHEIKQFLVQFDQVRTLMRRMGR